MHAFGMNMTNVATGTSGMIEITVDRWSTPEERQEIITTMTEKGQDQLLRVLSRAKDKGHIRLPAYAGPDPNNYRLGWDLRYAWQESLPEGVTRIVLATDRYMSMWELQNRPRSSDYPFTFMEIRMPKTGKGQGRLSVANKIRFDKKKNVVEMEQYSAGPVHLNEITLEKK
jgi:hypothetical protein